MRFLLVILVACACSEPAARPRDPAPVSDPAPAPPVACPAGAPTSGYDQWPPGDHCGELDQRWSALPASARTCAADRDCTVVTGMCFSTAMRADVAGSYRETPCAHPAGGMCPPGPPERAVCVDGCCVIAP